MLHEEDKEVRELERKVWQMRDRLDKLDCPLDWMVGGWWNAGEDAIVAMYCAISNVLESVENLARVNKAAVEEAAAHPKDGARDRFKVVADTIQGKFDKIV